MRSKILLASFVGVLNMSYCMGCLFISRAITYGGHVHAGKKWGTQEPRSLEIFMFGGKSWSLKLR